MTGLKINIASKLRSGSRGTPIQRWNEDSWNRRTIDYRHNDLEGRCGREDDDS